MRVVFFVLSNIPQGRYKITYRKEGLKTVSDSGIEVRSGERTRLGIKDMEADPAYPPPAPTGLYVIYDTVSGCAILRWNRVRVSDLAGYVVYRNDSASATPIQISKRLVTDTFYIDTVFSDLMDTRDPVFVYRVKSQDKEANLSSVYSKPFTISTPSPTKVRTFFSWHYFNTIGDSASIGDSVVIIVEYRNATRKNMRVSWYFERRDSLVRVINDTSFFGRDTIRCVWLVPSRPKIYVSVVDEGNSTWWDSTEIKIVQDVPVANAGEDTVVSINSVVPFSGRATQRFGSIVMYKWDYDGDGTYDDSSASSGNGTYVYRREGIYNARFYVRDDDGNEATDVRVVRVSNKTPQIISIRGDTTISINDTVEFYGTVTDNDGSIVEYAWDFNGDGTYEYRDIVIRTSYVYTTAGRYKVVLRVTDEDGNSSTDTVVVTVLQDVPVANAGEDTVVSINSVVPFSGRATQRFGSIVMYKWDYDSDGTYDDSSASSGNGTYVYRREGIYNARFYVRDDDGNEATDVRVVRVNNKAPQIISIRADTTISINDTVEFYGIATDEDGSIVEYAWDFNGDGKYEYIGSEIRTKYVYTTAGTYRSVLRVTDDDGKVSKDTVIIIVLRDEPVIMSITRISPSGIISIYDTIVFTATVTDGYGSIVSYQWSVNNGRVLPDAGPGVRVIAGGKAGVLRCTLVVTDDDGMKDTAVIVVDVCNCPPVVVASSSRDSVWGGDTVTLSTTGTRDSCLLGKALTYEWMIDTASRTWIPYSGKDTIITIPNFYGTLVAILKVTDEDGLKGYDTVRIRVFLKDIYVDCNATGANNGRDWMNAFTDLQDGLSIAKYGSTIHVAAGTYYPTKSPSNDRNVSFILKNGVKIYGGYPHGGGIRDTANKTILSGDIQRDDYIENNVYSVMKAITPLDTSTLLWGLTITGGFDGVWGGAIEFGEKSVAIEISYCLFINNHTHGRGGAMYFSNGSRPTITNCIFINNTTSWDGGVMYISNSSPIITNCTFSNNKSDSYGGVMAISNNSSPTITNCTFSNNTNFWGGGVMYISNSTPTITNCNFSNNKSVSEGGVMEICSNSTPTITNCTFSNNSCSYGGVMYISNSSPQITDCIFSENTTTSEGGVMYIYGNSTPTITNCSFSNNSSGSYGGVMLIIKSSPKITNCSFSNNTGVGGAIYVYENSSPTINKCTFSKNTGFSAGAILIYNSSPIIADCIFSENTNSSYFGGGAMEISGGSPTITNCTFSNNNSSNGGAMSISYSSVTLTDCIFSNNTSSYNGGAINISDQSTLTITNCTFSNNSGSSGGAMYISYSSFTITNSTFRNNKSGSNGGAIYFGSEESSVVRNCTFVGCKASDNGGAIYNIYESSTLFLTNCTFINDTATSGGACFNYLGARTIYTNCTFVSNVATSFGGAVYNRAYVSKDSVKSTFINCLFWSNEAPEGSQLYLGEYTSPRLYNCVIEGGYSGHGVVSNIITEDPLLGTFGDHGGAVFTIPIDASSPARNAGTTEMVPPEVDISTDARGYPRSDGAPDIGAYEVQ